MRQIAMLGTGLIGNFYTSVLHGQRSRDRVQVVYSRTEERGSKFAQDWDIPRHTTDLKAAINDPGADVVVVGLPNHLHKEAVVLAAKAGKAVLCTKPLGRTAVEAKAMLDAVEKAGVFAGYLEDLVYPPKMLKSMEFVKSGAIGKVLWARSRETHPGPHSAWFWDKEQSGGGAIVDMGCHCIEIARSYIGKDVRPVEAVCWADTQVHPIEAEDHGIGLVRYENGAVGQFEVSWTFRGGMDLRDEVAGSEGTVWSNNFLRTGLEWFTASGRREGYVAEKAESEKGWLFPAGDEAVDLGYVNMFTDMFNAMEQGREPMETFYDGYVVNAIMDTCYKSARTKRWEPVRLAEWRGSTTAKSARVSKPGKAARSDGAYQVIKREKLADGRTKVILKHRKTGEVVERVEG